MCADALYAGLDILRPNVDMTGRETVKGEVVIGVVEGDVHDIGKNLVKMMFEVAGFTVHDLGADVPIDEFVEKQISTNSDIVALSAMMTTTMMGMKKAIVEAEREEPQRQDHDRWRSGHRRDRRHVRGRRLLRERLQRRVRSHQDGGCSPAHVTSTHVGGEVCQNGRARPPIVQRTRGNKHERKREIRDGAGARSG